MQATDSIRTEAQLAGRATGAMFFFAFAALYPRLASGGPAAPVGFLGAGLILWLSAAWALRA
ncbi:hypothetical protein ACL58G_29755 [Massilia sp. GER05]|uniref:hypothetical protein n=1 Tax=Massilia sp. GER05 TaxID=3394605 RepID=UPI003F849BE5